MTRAVAKKKKPAKPLRKEKLEINVRSIVKPTTKNRVTDEPIIRRVEINLEDLIFQGQIRSRLMNPSINGHGILVLPRAWFIRESLLGDDAWIRLAFSPAMRGILMLISLEEKKGYKKYQRGGVNIKSLLRMSGEIEQWKGTPEVEKMHVVGLGDSYLLSKPRFKTEEEDEDGMGGDV